MPPAAEIAEPAPTDPAAGGATDTTRAAATTTGEQPCPNCGVPNAPDALFCEACGYDHTTGAMPRRSIVAAADPDAVPAGESPAPTLAQPWVAEVWVDPQWYAGQESPDPLPSAGPPRIVPLRHTSLLIGRLSRSRNIAPEIDCGNDNGVSRRQAQLTTDGTRWWVEDLDSSNGTFLGDAVGELPTRPIPPGAKREVDPDDRIYVGSWTRVVIRPAVQGEVTG